jgi:hypothetical protein
MRLEKSFERSEKTQKNEMPAKVNVFRSAECLMLAAKRDV